MQPEDSGSYVCAAENPAGVRHRVVSLAVLAPPSISRLPRDQEVAVGEPLKLVCEAHGSPPPHIIWMVNDTALDGMSGNQTREQDYGEVDISRNCADRYRKNGWDCVR